MRFRQKDEKNFIKVGVFITLLTLVLTIMILSIGKENSFFESKIDLRARVESVSNLKPGAYVELKGIRVGTVEAIDIISDEEVEITLRILESKLKWIKQDAKISISTAGLVGDKFLEIYNGSKSAPQIDPAKDILVSENLADMKMIMSKGESIATITERILTRLDQIIYNMDDGKKIVDTMNSLQKSSLNLEKITSELRDAQLGATVKKVNSSMSSLERILKRIEQGPGSMNSIIYDDGVHEDLRALLGGASRNKVIKYFIRESIKNSERKKPKSDQ